jgi:hypothetical protein
MSLVGRTTNNKGLPISNGPKCNIKSRKVNLLDHVFLFLFCIYAIEILSIFQVKKCLTTISQKGLTSIRVILSNKISDHWKEIATQMYAAVIFVNVLKLGFVILLISIGVLCADHLYLDFLSVALSVRGLFEAGMMSFIYINLKKYVYE